MNRKKLLDIQNRSRCGICGKAFEFNEVCFLGHHKDGSCRYICSDCCNKWKDLDECTDRRRFSHSVPAPEAKLWRYMDLSKFLSLLEDSSLYFTRLDHFDDLFEGALGYQHNEKAWVNRNLTIREKIMQGEKGNMNDNDYKEYVRNHFNEVRKREQIYRRCKYVNCWHVSDCESEAMWKLYTRDNKQGIAIQTTLERLYNAIRGNCNLDFGLINYIDFNEYNNGKSDNVFGLDSAIWCKRKSFAHEAEFRVVATDMKRPGFNSWDKQIPVNLEQLIENVFISPEADDWFVKLVGNIIKNRYHYGFNVIQSELMKLPFY